MKIKNSSFFIKLLFPILLLVVFEIMLLIGLIQGSGLMTYMENNEMEILHEHVLNRTDYLESEMVDSWANIEWAAEEINQKTKDLLQADEISMGTLCCSSETAAPFIANVAQNLISLMRTNKVTGVFLVLNTEDLEQEAERGSYKNKPGIYIRDYDPTSTPSARNMDLLLEYAPPAVVKNLNISLDKGWTTQFEFEALENYSTYFYEPFMAAVRTEDRSGMKATDFGRWSEPYQLYNDKVEAIAYSVPLFLEDGTVYGVLGIEISLDYLKTLLPWNELTGGETVAYLLGYRKDSETEIKNVLIHGKAYEHLKNEEETTVLYQQGDRTMVVNDLKENIYCEVQEMQLYDANTAFSHERWVLAGIVNEEDLFSFSYSVKKILILVIFCSMVTGIIGAVLISLVLSKPVTELTKNVEKRKPFDHIRLPKTDIWEIDLLAEKLEKLNEETLYAAEKFSYIIQDTKLPIAVFEVNRENKTVFITGRLFELLGVPQQEEALCNEEKFLSILESIEKYKQMAQNKNALEQLYRIPISQQSKETAWRYIRISMKEEGNHCIGFAEDVTKNEEEKEFIEYERDHDILTGLLNRRAFNRKMEWLFTQGEGVLATAALVMVDLDNLKYINDTYGHDYGDKYIQMVAQCFAGFTPQNTIKSRLSGDEFHLFFYGYENKEQVRKLFEQLKTGIESRVLTLPNGETKHISMSVGVAWYPQDSTDYDTLHTYSDSAMYQVKHGTKNRWAEYEREMKNNGGSSVEVDKNSN